jgi:hypothetical protein
MKFTLEIELGNDAMQTYVDVSDQLKWAVSNYSLDAIPAAGDSGLLMDHNGKALGKWAITE